MQFPVGKLRDEDPHKEGWRNHIELGYVIVIPQEYGHAIITACAASDQFRSEEITQIHDVFHMMLNLTTRKCRLSKRENHCLIGYGVSTS